jgi:hypothetical protein
MANGGLATNFNLISPEVREILEAKNVNIDGALIIARGTSQFESNNDVNAKQSLGKEKDRLGKYGVARGMYQHEPESAKTAYTRANTALGLAPQGKDTPPCRSDTLPWLKDLCVAKFDVVKAKLTAQEQTDLFVLDQLMAPLANKVDVDGNIVTEMINGVSVPVKAKGFIATTNDIVNATSADAMSEEAYNYWLYNHHGTKFDEDPVKSAEQMAQSKRDWLIGDRNGTHTLIMELFQQQAEPEPEPAPAPEPALAAEPEPAPELEAVPEPEPLVPGPGPSIIPDGYTRPSTTNIIPEGPDNLLNMARGGLVKRRAYSRAGYH